MKKLLRIEGRKAYVRYMKAWMNKPRYNEPSQSEAVFYTTLGMAIAIITTIYVLF